MACRGSTGYRVVLVCQVKTDGRDRLASQDSASRETSENLVSSILFFVQCHTPPTPYSLLEDFGHPYLLTLSCMLRDGPKTVLSLWWKSSCQERWSLYWNKTLAADTSLDARGNHIDGLMQERRNSSALAMEFVFLALTHRYLVITQLSHFILICGCFFT